MKKIKEFLNKKKEEKTRKTYEAACKSLEDFTSQMLVSNQALIEKHYSLMK